MRGQGNRGVFPGIVLSVSLLSASFGSVLASGYYKRMYFQKLGTICEEIIENQPEAEGLVMSALKASQGGTAAGSGQTVLSLYGYRQSGFMRAEEIRFLVCAAAGFWQAAFCFRPRKTGIPGCRMK